MPHQELMDPILSKKNLLLADDDSDDCLLFSNAVAEIAVSIQVETVHDGEELMNYLQESTLLPDIIFLDMNMPRKNGADCLSEIKANKKIQSIPVVIISTSLEPSLIDFIHTNGAHYFIRKPNSFSKLKFLLHHSITLLEQQNVPQPARGQFVLADEKATL